MDICWGYPPPTNSEIIICSSLWRAPYKPSLSTVSGPGIPSRYIFFRWKQEPVQHIVIRCFQAKIVGCSIKILPKVISLLLHRGFLKWWYPTTMGFPTKNYHFGVFWGYHHLRKHPHSHHRYPNFEITYAACISLPSIVHVSFAFFVFDTTAWCD